MAVGAHGSRGPPAVQGPACMAKERAPEIATNLRHLQEPRLEPRKAAPGHAALSHLDMTKLGSILTFSPTSRHLQLSLSLHRIGSRVIRECSIANLREKDMAWTSAVWCQVT